MKGFEQPYILPFNKAEKTREKIKRKNSIVIGDSDTDADIIETGLKIGLYNNNEIDKNKFYSKFDIIIENNGTFKPIQLLLNWLNNEQIENSSNLSNLVSFLTNL